MPIRLMENFRAVFYAPYYATHALGFYKREGVDVELLTSDAPGDAVPKLIDGTIDLTWGGPMRVMKARDDDPGRGPRCGSSASERLAAECAASDGRAVGAVCAVVVNEPEAAHRIVSCAK